MANVNNSFTFFKSDCTSNFSSILVLIIRHWFFTWIALGDTNLCLSLMLVRSANVVEEETT